MKIDIKGLLQLDTGEHELELELSTMEDIGLDEPYLFKIETMSMIPPKMIVADFAVSNEFNTHYIPKNEPVNLTIRIQNVCWSTNSIKNLISEIYELEVLIKKNTSNSLNILSDFLLNKASII